MFGKEGAGLHTVSCPSGFCKDVTCSPHVMGPLSKPVAGHLLLYPLTALAPGEGAVLMLAGPTESSGIRRAVRGDLGWRSAG